MSEWKNQYLLKTDSPDINTLTISFLRKYTRSVHNEVFKEIDPSSLYHNLPGTTWVRNTCRDPICRLNT